jgi:tRNA/tmRNA/rRNA uracil-C5-methylase (TrmA/RlmC/RlmD family)
MQVNREGGGLLHRAVLRAIGPAQGLTVVDAYAGVGVLGRILAEQGATVTAIELDREAAGAAEQGAPTTFRMLQGRVEKLLEQALPADLVVLNPPRTGVDEGALARLSASGVRRIVYVSCDPATLARDVRRLADFRVAQVSCFDLFPQTTHVETLLVLERS